ncbi:MAG: hypothetical protein J6S04_01295 [Clostridia bacterium]|nr:hypothetical protein [Clostridia bacterium]
MIRMKRSKPITTGTRVQTRRATLRFSDDKSASGVVLKPLAALNCDYSGGVLQTLPEWEYMLDENGERYNCNIPNILEVGSLKVDKGSQSFRNGYYLITQAGSYLYYMDDEAGFYSVATNRVRVATFFVKMGDEPRLAICTRKGFLLAKLDGSYQTIIQENTLSAGALFKHRIFVAMRGGVVKYSAPEDFTNFTETADGGGSIAFPHCGGEIIAIKTYEDALYIFFKSGIMRLTVGGDPSGFYAERLDYTGGDIFVRTICVCQHAIYFLARGGLYRLKGKRTERLDIEADFPSEENLLEGCSVWKDRPMIRYQKPDGEFQTIVVAQDGKSAFFMYGLETLGRGEDGRVLFTDDLKYLCQLTEKGEHWFEGSFHADPTDFGCIGRKRLERVRFYGEGSFYFTITWNGRRVAKELEFLNGVAELKLNHAEYGEQFKMTFILGRATKITKVQVEYKTFA